MNEKTRLSSEKEKVKESQSRRVAPPLDIHFGCRVGGITPKVTERSSGPFPRVGKDDL